MENLARIQGLFILILSLVFYHYNVTKSKQDINSNSCLHLITLKAVPKMCAHMIHRYVTWKCYFHKMTESFSFFNTPRGFSRIGEKFDPLVFIMFTWEC